MPLKRNGNQTLDSFHGILDGTVKERSNIFYHRKIIREGEDKMIEHIVIFKFKESASMSQIENAIIMLKDLKKEIPGIVDIQAGQNLSKRSQGFELGLTVRIENIRALEEYGPHPKHQEIVRYLEKIGLVDTIILDFLI
jgi:hypothetical protein